MVKIVCTGGFIPKPLPSTAGSLALRPALLLAYQSVSPHHTCELLATVED